MFIWLYWLGVFMVKISRKNSFDESSEESGGNGESPGSTQKGCRCRIGY